MISRRYVVAAYQRNNTPPIRDAMSSYDKNSSNAKEKGPQKKDDIFLRILIDIGIGWLFYIGVYVTYCLVQFLVFLVLTVDIFHADCIDNLRYILGYPLILVLTLIFGDNTDNLKSAYPFILISIFAYMTFLSIFIGEFFRAICIVKRYFFPAQRLCNELKMEGETLKSEESD